MCGIVGTVTTDNNPAKLASWLSDALITSQVRGVHSTGLFQIKKDHKSFRTFKRAVNASTFVEIKEADDIISDAGKFPLTVGHVRHATVGQKTDINAHPFVAVGDRRTVIGVHNGTLQGWHGISGSSTSYSIV